MIQPGDSVFVDTSAWIALALTRDPLHGQALEAWETLTQVGAHLVSSVPVVIETFTFLDRNARREVAVAWKDSLSDLRNFDILTCRPEDLEAAWIYFQRRDLHKLSAVDATSFVLMRRKGIRGALTFDHHFAMVGFEPVA